jgi:hypothetical protein
MKKISIGLLALVCACIFTFTFIACDHGNDKNTDPSATEQQVWLPYTILDHFENCKRTYYYDEYGNEIKMTKEDLNGNIQATWLCEYDTNHNLIKQSVDTGNGEPFVQLIQTFDDKGNLIEKRQISSGGESVSTYQYDEQNRLISRSNGGQIVETYTYEADGSYKIQKVNNPNEYSIYRADGKIQERHVSPNIKMVYSYSAGGVLLECTTYSGENTTQKQIYHFDDHGNLNKIIQVNAAGEETVMGEYEYKLYTVKVK